MSASGSRIHPTAVIEPGAVLGAGVAVGAFAWIGARVTLGDGCVVHHHGTVDGLTTMGPGCEVFPHACIGLKTQDLKFAGGAPGTRIGARNVFREFVTVHAATNDGDFTVIGDDNLFLAYAHVAHDCVVGDHVVASNNATLAGHVVIGDHVIIGGMGGVHQFCRVGPRAMVGGMSKVVQDVPPCFIADGNPATIRGFNRVGLERAGFDEARIERVKAAYKTLYRAGLNRSQAVAALEARPDATSAEIAAVLDFVRASERGICGGPER